MLVEYIRKPTRRQSYITDIAFLLLVMSLCLMRKAQNEKYMFLIYHISKDFFRDRFN